MSLNAMAQPLLLWPLRYSLSLSSPQHYLLVVKNAIFYQFIVMFDTGSHQESTGNCLKLSVVSSDRMKMFNYRHQ
jgi:hypothetical protein